MEGNIPSPNFSQSNSDFLSFSSTPIRGGNFKPKWGKKNRQDNWTRFGNSQNEFGPGYSTSNNSFSSGGSYQHSRGRGGWNRGGRGSEHRGYQGYNRGYNTRGFNNSWGGRHSDSSPGGYGNKEEGYFHPSMLRDPWEELKREMENQNKREQQSEWDISSISVEGENKILSDSLIPQVGDTLCARNEHIEDTDIDNLDVVVEESVDKED